MQSHGYFEQVLVPVGAATTYCLSLQAAQVAGRACHVSCATLRWSSVLGCLAVSSSSLAAGQVAFAAQKYLKQGPGRPKDFMIPKEDAAFAMIVGLTAFKIFGGRFCNLMPSHVCHPGALANISIRATGPKLASSVQGQKICKAFLKDGCHHCGSRSGQSISDHIPPNMIMKALRQQRKRGFWMDLFNLKEDSWWTKKLNLKAATIPAQRLYPQCVSCMRRQSAFLLNGKDPFIFHWKRGLPKPSHLSSLLLGALTYKGHTSHDEPEEK
ncbi:hypothetical protein GOP47_0029940 [Adiantum capillus-veneris]|nr:hypothetical protein GOP47_0029940 [Adiantum capillus-veneris]